MPFTPWMGVAKVGFELFSTAGPASITAAIDRGYEVFADLKLHDIPTTVGRAAAKLGRTGVRWLTVHTVGGADMLRAGVEGLAEGSDGSRPGSRGDHSDQRCRPVPEKS